MFISDILFYFLPCCDNLLKKSLYVMNVEDTALQGLQNAKYLDISQRRITLGRGLRSDVSQVKVKGLHKEKILCFLRM